jgi:hypothetical protein
MKKGGFYYYVDEEKIRRYKALPAEEKLEWLEEINEFIWKYGMNREIRRSLDEERSDGGD